MGWGEIGWGGGVGSGVGEVRWRKIDREVMVGWGDKEVMVASALRYVCVALDWGAYTFFRIITVGWRVECRCRVGWCRRK